MEDRFYTRIKRGMVFWYNINPSVNKYDVPELRLTDTKSARDYMEYGDRPWLLVSVDEKNIQGRTCTVVPLCTNTAADKDPYHVPIRYKGKDALILCEHLRTINCIELIKYDCTLEDKTMKMVEACMREYLGIQEDPLAGLASNEIVKRLEGVINEIVKKKVEEERAAITKVVDVDDAVLRISEGLETIFDVKASKKEELVKEEPKKEEVDSVDEFVGALFKTQESVQPTSNFAPRQKRTRRIWNKPMAIDFIQEVEVLGADKVALKYGYTDGGSVKKTISYLNRKFSLK